MIEQQDLIVTDLGKCRHVSPLNLGSASHERGRFFVSDSERIRLDLTLRPETEGTDPPSLEKAGPRERIFFEPGRTTAAIVTCGGLSPGLNNVIRSVFYEPHNRVGSELCRTRRRYFDERSRTPRGLPG